MAKAAKSKKKRASTANTTTMVKAKKAKAKKAKTQKAKTEVKARSAASSVPGARLVPPEGGAAVRMYRIGHGDCFLIAFSSGDPAKPAYVLIDCGYKPGSPDKIVPPTSPDDVVRDIRHATGGHVDVAVITHEHQDHVNAITDKRFNGITIGEAWFAWTEDPADDLANDLRKKFKDRLVGLVAARNQLAAAGGDAKRAAVIDEFLAFELGGNGDGFDAATANALLSAAKTGAEPASMSMNKKSMKVFKDKAERGIKYLRPHSKIYSVPRAQGVRVFPLGPPRDTELLASLDPTGNEEFHMASLSSTSSNHFAAAALAADDHTKPQAPFAPRYAVEWDAAFQSPEHRDFYSKWYGNGKTGPLPPETYDAPTDADWRRIDKDWLYASAQLALDMNDQTNNSSLVLAFELGKGGKVLLFAADAQRGNWISWAKKDFNDADAKVTVRSLMSRTVLYKVGHHGSHNATINGQTTDAYTNLSWMAEGEHSHEFCAMITAVRAWAETQKGWDHPLKAIKDALLKKAAGRVFQTDTPFTQMSGASHGSAVDWKAFTARTSANDLYFDYRIEG